MTKKFVLTISGGRGKNIMATSIVRQIRKENPKSEIIISTPHTFIWKNNPDINELLQLENNTELYKKHIKGQDTKVFVEEPYHQENFIYKREHLMKTWCRLCECEWDGSSPSLFFSDEEKQIVQEKLEKHSQGKPIFMIQTNGGDIGQKYPISWARDLPLHTAQEIVDEMNKRGYACYHQRRKEQPSLIGADHIDTALNIDLRLALCSVEFADKRLFIDSLFQHAAAAFNKSAVVPWILTQPEIFGYALHDNVVSHMSESFRHHLDSYLEEDDITGWVYQCPFDSNELFDAKDLLERLDAQS